MPTGADVTLISMKPDDRGWLVYDTAHPTVIKSDPQTGRFTFPGVYQGNFTVSSSNIFRPMPVSAGGAIAAEGQTVDVELALKGTVNPDTGEADRSTPWARSPAGCCCPTAPRPAPACG